VFQNYALFPHMTVEDNIAFPLKMRKVDGAELRRRVGEALEIVRLPQVAKRYPRELSGGQQQRIALARCMVYRPSIILMDEPLGALDKKLREQMQLEIKRIHRELRTTIVYVTHDQEEAMTMSDRICLMNAGRIEQLGSPGDLYFRPCSLFVADFLGESNLLPARVSDASHDGLTVTLTVADAGADGTRLTLALRPERVRLAPAGGQARASGPMEASGYRWWQGVIEEVVYIGATRKYQVRLGGQLLVAQQQAGSDVPGFRAGERVDVGWSMADVRVVYKH